MHPLVKLTKSTIEKYVEEKEVISPPPGFPKEFLKKKSGVFITIKKPGEYLRGCVGTYLPTQKNIAEEVIENAIAAATKDFRFGSIEKEELPDLSYEVSILRKPELIKDKGGLNPRKYGIIIKTSETNAPKGNNVSFNGYSPFKTGLLLPGIEGINTPDEQIAAASQKAGIDLNKEKITIYRFETQKFK